MNSRRNFLKQATGVAGFSILTSPKAFSMLLQDQKFTTEMVRDEVGIFKGRGGTIMWLDSSDGIAVVDTQNQEYAGLLIDYLKNTSGNQLSLLFNSHHHGDHSGGNLAFKGLVNQVIAHENSLKNQKSVAEARDRVSTQLYPDTTFSKKWKTKLGKETISCKYFGNAHTDGDAIIHFENANVAHVGDLIFNRRHPYIDQSAGAHIGNWIQVIEDIKKNYDKDTLFICGHSGSGYDVKLSKDDLSAKQEYLEKLLKVVSADITSGKSKEEILARTEIPGIEWTANGISRPLTAAFNELSEK